MRTERFTRAGPPKLSGRAGIWKLLEGLGAAPSSATAPAAQGQLLCQEFSKALATRERERVSVSVRKMLNDPFVTLGSLCPSNPKRL